MSLDPANGVQIFSAEFLSLVADYLGTDVKEVSDAFSTAFVTLSKPKRVEKHLPVHPAGTASHGKAKNAKGKSSKVSKKKQGMTVDNFFNELSQKHIEDGMQNYIRMDLLEKAFIEEVEGTIDNLATIAQEDYSDLLEDDDSLRHELDKRYNTACDPLGVIADIPFPFFLSETPETYGNIRNMIYDYICTKALEVARQRKKNDAKEEAEEIAKEKKKIAAKSTTKGNKITAKGRKIRAKGKHTMLLLLLFKFFVIIRKI